jgi:hypothetical protein
MKIDLINVDRFVEEHQLVEITSSNIFTSKSIEPDPAGLLSYEIFGRPGTRERKTVYGYIDLGTKFIHPHVYRELTQLQRNLIELFAGEAEFYIKDGVLIKLKEGEEPPPNTKKGTGVDFFYKHYSEVDFKPVKGQAEGTLNKRRFLSILKKEEVFISKILVIPAFYRDVDIHTKKKNEINVFYQKIISNAAAVKSTSVMYDLFGTTTAHRAVQNTVNEMAAYFETFLGGTHGFVYKNIMGKGSDFTGRLVISNGQYNSDTVEDCEVSYTHCALPLDTAVKIFNPFVKFGVRKIVNNIIRGSKFIYAWNKKSGEVDKLILHPAWKDELSDTKLDKLIELYCDSKEHRLDIFTLPLDDDKKAPLGYILEDTDSTDIIGGGDTKTKELLVNGTVKTMNLTELFYMATYNTCSDKSVYVTRFPVDNHNSIYPMKANIIPCLNYKVKTVDGISYPRFPVIPKEGIKFDLTHFYGSTLRVHNSQLTSLGADYDGDTVSVYSVFSNEANEVAQKHIYSKSNCLDLKGGTMRSMVDNAGQALFFLTFRREKPI